MTVGELVEKLRKYPSEMLVAIRNECEDDGEYDTIRVEHHGNDDEVIMVIE